MLAFLLSITLTNNTVTSFVANSNEYDAFEVPPETFVVLDYKDEIEIKAVFPNGTSLSVQDEEASQLYTDKNTNVNLYIGSNKNALVSIHTRNPMTCSQAYIVTDNHENTDISPEDCLQHPYYQKCVDMCANNSSHNFCPHICEKAPSEGFCSVIINSQDLSRYAMDVKDDENYTNYIESCYNSLTECDQLCTNKRFSYFPVCQYYNCSLLIPAMKRAQRTTYHKIHPAMYPVMALWEPSTMTWKTDTIANRMTDFPSADDKIVVVGSKEPYRSEDNWNYEWGEQYVLSGSFLLAVLSVVVLVGGVLVVNRILSTYQ